MKKFIISITFFLFTTVIFGQVKNVSIQIIDEFNNPIPEVVMKIVGNKIETFSTDENGIALIPALEGEEIQIIKFNEQMRTIRINSPEMIIQLGKYHQIFDLGYDEKVTKENSAAAINGVSSQVIEASGQFNILNNLYGLIPGLYLLQGDTNPWNQHPNLYIRGRGSFAGNNVIILVDGVEREISKIDRKEIESIVVMKDAASLSMYGSRGADGIINFMTKRGGDHKLRIQAGYTSSIQTPFRIPEMADAYSYANAINEALENDGLEPRYTQRDILSIKNGEKSHLLPNVNWRKELIRERGYNNEIDMQLDGSTERTRYYVYTNYTSNRGLLNNTNLNEDYSTQTELYALKIRTNLETQITPTTTARMNVMGRLLQYQQPNSGLSLDGVYNVPAAAFPIRNEQNQWIRNQMFLNPLAEKTARGYNVTLQRALLGDITLDQSLSMILSGLAAQFRLAYDNSADIYDSKSKDFSYLDFVPIRDEIGNVENINYSRYGNDTELRFGSWLSGQVMRTSVWGKVNYAKKIGNHNVDISGIYSQNFSKYAGANNSYMYRDYLTNINYNYDNKYILNGVLSYSGSGKLIKGNKYRVYPAISGAWILSNESFLNKNNKIDFLKLRASFGATGMDRNLSYDMDKQFNGGGKGYIFVGTQWKGGLGEGTLPSKTIEPEKEYKANVGVELGLWKHLTMEIDAFYNHRKNIRVSPSGTLSDVIGIGVSDIFSGEVKNYGGEFFIGWTKKNKDFSYFINANISYSKNKIVNIEEGYTPYPYMKRIGQSIGRFYGLTSDGLYQDSDFENDGSLKTGIPSSSFIQNLQPGDVRYKDLNNDGVINEYDNSFILSASLPEIYYGINLKTEYKNISLFLVFQGTANSTVITQHSSIYWPLYENNKNISNYYLDNYWTIYTPNARYPRLTTLPNANNFRGSSLWTEKGNYLKLRTAELSFNIPERVIKKINITECRLILRGTNLFSIDDVKVMDPEFISMGYPSLRTYSLGLNVKF